MLPKQLPVAAHHPMSVPGENAQAGMILVEEVYPLDLAEMIFLKEYGRHLDEVRASKSAGWSSAVLGRRRKKPGVQQEMQMMQRRWRNQIAMTSEQAAGRFMENLGSMEKAFAAGNMEVSAALAKMNSDLLKATGHFARDSEQRPPNITINLDLSGGKVMVDGSDPTTITLKKEEYAESPPP